MARFLLVLLVVVASFREGQPSSSINVVNRCNRGGSVEFTGRSGIFLSQGASTGALEVASGWSGRVSFDPYPSSLAEFSVEVNNKNTMDISLVDGFNYGIQLAYTGGGCIRNGSPASSTITCRIQLSQCPSQFRSGNRCVNPNRDAETSYSSTVKGICPDAYSWSKDDATSTFTCNTGGVYTVTFCP